MTVKAKRFLRMSLLTWFLILSISCLTAFILARIIRAPQVEANAIDAIRDLGIEVSYCFDYEIKAYEKMQHEHEPSPVPPGPDWLKKMFGKMIFARIESVELTGEFKTLDDCHESLASLAQLKELDINSGTLESIDVLRCLGGLKIVRLKGCSDRLKNVNGLENLQLSRVVVSECHGLLDLGSLGEITPLQTLRVWDCGEISELNFSGWASSVFEDATVANCERLSSIVGLPESLKFLEVSNCELLTKIQMQNAPRLCSVDIRGCDQLVSFRMPLQKVEFFSLVNCDGIRNLDLSQSVSNLKRLHVDSCSELVSISGLSESVEELVIINCKSLKQIEFNGSFPNLKKIDFKNCPKTKETLEVVWLEEQTRLLRKENEPELID